MIFFFIKWTLILVFFVLLAFTIRTLVLEYSDMQAKFIAGKVPASPDGLYKGTLPGYTTSWQGKKFMAKDSTGINLFDDGAGGKVEKYPFKTSEGKGSRDSQLSVLKIDYNVSANTFWLWPVLDEVVEVSPGHLLGKFHLRIIPGFPFTIAFFELEK